MRMYCTPDRDLTVRALLNGVMEKALADLRGPTAVGYTIDV